MRENKRDRERENEKPTEGKEDETRVGERSDGGWRARSYESGAAVFVSPSYGHHVRRD